VCGVTGFINYNNPIKNMQIVVHRMNDQLAHRGPDDRGIWVDEQAGIALGHPRLSIIDVSCEGRQPMISESGRYVIAYNGEVYNFQKLKKELQIKGHIFRSHSDTEVMLAAFEEWGIEEAVKRFIGMFAFALWDRDEHILYLVRDRLGIKPLYYGWVNGAFVFGLELKALQTCPGFCQPIDRTGLAVFMRYNCIPAPYSIYEDIFKLLPGHIVKIFRDSKDIEITRYWSAQSVAKQRLTSPFKGSDDEAVEQLDWLLRDAVKCRMIADVPLGAFLSGGID